MTNEIDMVIPMVFPQDREWQRDYAGYSSFAAAAKYNERFRSWDTEELLIECVRKYMPWVRKIHILLARESQVQPWMGKFPEVHLVFHREFMDAKVLPCFNVLTIEMFLHRIPGLSEMFIYSNDDFFPLSPLEETDFFRDGLPCQRFVEKPYPKAPNVFERFVKNGLDMVAEDFGRTFDGTWLRGGHSMQPMLLETVRRVCQRHADRIYTSFTVERTARNFNQYIYPFWQHLSGEYADHVPKRQYVGPRTPTGDIAAIIRDPDCGIVCLNDNEMITDWLDRAAIVRQEIRKKLGCP